MCWWRAEAFEGLQCEAQSPCEQQARVCAAAWAMLICLVASGHSWWDSSEGGSLVSSFGVHHLKVMHLTATLIYLFWLDITRLCQWWGCLDSSTVPTAFQHQLFMLLGLRTCFPALLPTVHPLQCIQCEMWYTASIQDCCKDAVSSCQLARATSAKEEALMAGL